MPKVNVYLPDDLHDEVRRYEIALSPVCQAALRAAVAEKERLRSATADVAAVAARLRADKQAADERRHATGYELGANWAQATASWSDLERIVWHRLGDTTLVLLPEGHSLRRQLISWAMGQDPDFDPYGAYEKLEGDDAFDRGVLQGIHDVFESVKDLVQ